MNGRLPVGYVVEVDGADITLNLLDLHRGQFAAHAYGVSSVTEVGSLLCVSNGPQALIVKVLALSFAEPKEAHRAGVGSSTHQLEPLRHLRGVVVGRLVRRDSGLTFEPDSLATPQLGAEAFPLAGAELATVLGSKGHLAAPVTLGTDLRGGGELHVGLESLVSRHVAVLGSSGQGKSCFTAAVLQQVIKFPASRIVIFDVNGEYEDALRLQGLAPGTVKVTRIGGAEQNAYRIPYYALGRYGLSRLLMPSEKTQRPALAFSLQHLHQVQSFAGGVGLSTDTRAFLFDDCRTDGAPDAFARIGQLRSNAVPASTAWPGMEALCALVAESHAITPDQRTGYKRDAFFFSNVSPLVTRIRRFIDDEMFTDVVDVRGGAPRQPGLNWQRESSQLVADIFGDSMSTWRAHVVDLRRVTHDLMPFVMGSLLELYAHELFKRGQENKIPTLLVLEEAHHYLRQIGSGEEAAENSLAYERLAKEGRKFGLALWLSTQRPSEISPTVLSQCNNWVTFRLTSEKDLNAIQAASEWADRRDVRRIAGLPRQHAMVFGGSLAMPTLIKTTTANPLPRSEDGPFDSWVYEPLV